MAEASADSSVSSPQKPNPEKFNELVDEEQYTIKKRLPRTFPKRKNDVYVSSKTNLKVQLNRCLKHFDENGFQEVFIHGLGNAINRAINLALQVQVHYGNVMEVSTHTSTLELIDDLDPKTEDAEPGVHSRNNSAVHIRVYRKDPASDSPDTVIKGT
ncbi:ribonuclease P protein subunit p20-like [Lineus longissimus]|uniref:ribonuclease P protein subunit p20-like n=1 Tax=Lineus longissimus TaxID=88925 RepID=UPI00315C59CD